MEDHIKYEIGWKQKAKKNLTLTSRRLLEGVVRNGYSKINHLGSATRFPAYGTAEMLKDCEIKFEQKKAEAIQFLRRRAAIK